MDKPKILKNNTNFQKAKQSIGLVRGRLKNKIKAYYKLTEKFKSIAPELGRNFADLREKFKEQDEQTKIGFYGIIVEDKYLLLTPIDKNGDRDVIEDKLLTIGKKGYLQVKKVFSFTSKALKKIENSRAGYPAFHHTKNFEEEYSDLDTIEIKESKKLQYIKNCLLSSDMAKEQAWSEKFKWDNRIKDANTREKIDKILDVYGYKMEEKYISIDSISNLIKGNQGYLLPLISQDFANFDEITFTGLNNRFTSDFELAINNSDGYRIHPELNLFYQFPTEIIEAQNHHAKILNRYSRFQLKANVSIEILNKSNKNLITKKEQTLIVKDKIKYTELINNFNKNINNGYLNKSDSLVYSLDRGINEIATLCVQDKNSNIQDYIVFNKKKIPRTKLGRIGEIYSKVEDTFTYDDYSTQSILDLTNIKIETWHLNQLNHPNTINIFKKLEEIKVKPFEFEISKKLGYFDNLEGEDPKITFLVQYPNDSANNIRLKMKVYEREIQKKFSANRDYVKHIIQNIFGHEDTENLNQIKKKEIIKKLFGLNKNDTSNCLINVLDGDKPNINKLLNSNTSWFETLINLLLEIHKSVGISKLEQVQELDNLKRGVIANIVGVISFLFKIQKGVIVLENIASIRNTEDESQLQREQERWLGAEAYRYLETKLIHKFSRFVNLDHSVSNYTPPFINIDTLNKQLMISKNNIVENIYQFGIFYYILADNTSKVCPCCLTNFSVNKESDSEEEKKLKYKFRPRKQLHIFCQNTGCQLTTDRNKMNSEQVLKLAKKFNTIPSKNLLKIRNGDQNAAYRIGKSFINHN